MMMNLRTELDVMKMKSILQLFTVLFAQLIYVMNAQRSLIQQKHYQSTKGCLYVKNQKVFHL